MQQALEIIGVERRDGDRLGERQALGGGLGLRGGDAVVDEPQIGLLSGWA